MTFRSAFFFFKRKKYTWPSKSPPLDTAKLSTLTVLKVYNKRYKLQINEFNLPFSFSS